MKTFTKFYYRYRLRDLCCYWNRCWEDSIYIFPIFLFLRSYINFKIIPHRNIDLDQVSDLEIYQIQDQIWTPIPPMTFYIPYKRCLSPSCVCGWFFRFSNISAPSAEFDYSLLRGQLRPTVGCGVSSSFTEDLTVALSCYCSPLGRCLFDIFPVSILFSILRLKCLFTVQLVKIGNFWIKFNKNQYRDTDRIVGKESCIGSWENGIVTPLFHGHWPWKCILVLYYMRSP